VHSRSLELIIDTNSYTKNFKGVFPNIATYSASIVRLQLVSYKQESLEQDHIAVLLLAREHPHKTRARWNFE